MPKPGGHWKDAARALERLFPERWGDRTGRLLKQCRKEVQEMVRLYEARLGVMVKEAAAQGDKVAVALLAVRTRIRRMLARQNKKNPINIPDDSPPPKRTTRKKRGPSP